MINIVCTNFDELCNNADRVELACLTKNEGKALIDNIVGALPTGKLRDLFQAESISIGVDFDTEFWGNLPKYVSCVYVWTVDEAGLADEEIMARVKQFQAMYPELALMVETTPPDKTEDGRLIGILEAQGTT